MARTPYRYAERTCRLCGSQYTPHGPRQLRCEPCRIAIAVRRVVTGDATAPARPAERRVA